MLDKITHTSTAQIPSMTMNPIFKHYYKIKHKVITSFFHFTCLSHILSGGDDHSWTIYNFNEFCLFSYLLRGNSNQLILFSQRYLTSTASNLHDHIIINNFGITIQILIRTSNHCYLYCLKNLFLCQWSLHDY